MVCFFKVHVKFPKNYKKKLQKNDATNKMTTSHQGIYFGLLILGLIHENILNVKFSALFNNRKLLVKKKYPKEISPSQNLNE